ncbi:adenine glycosylase [Shewanella sp. SR44-4]|uniref:baseplate complex protein n=1 Tax=Shewanella sp. SR44-4 TaxID=2760935 RepID=UPI00160353A7|nr:adenine glycosylase [Shewanella sp. SR44-4]MBB1362100.1 adenine glycosylase [Shewanella sp. SR44-4]
MLNLNSTSIAIKSLRITASQELASDDASGQSSSTDVAETGTKAKMLMVSGNVLFNQAKNLTQLFELAEATENGARVIYRISNKTAEALGVKQVRFASKIEAVEQQTTRQWSVSFTLQEYRSVPQKVEERQPDAAANQQGASTTGESGFQYASLQQNLTDNFGSLRS